MKKHRLHKFQNTITQIIVFFIVGGLLASLMGCEALAKKFIRKPKGEEKIAEPVLVPQEYPSLFKTPEEAYKQYLFYWKSWQDELINSILSNASPKKKATCIDEAIKNLTFLKNLLLEEKQKGIDSYIKQLTDLKDVVSHDSYSMNATSHRMKAEAIRRNILRDYSYAKIKDFLKNDIGTN